MNYNTYTTLTFPTKDFDRLNEWNGYQFIAQEPGYYHAAAVVAFAAQSQSLFNWASTSGSCLRIMNINAPGNATPEAQSCAYPNNSSTPFNTMTSTATAYLTPGQGFRFDALHTVVGTTLQPKIGYSRIFIDRFG